MAQSRVSCCEPIINNFVYGCLFSCMRNETVNGAANNATSELNNNKKKKQTMLFHLIITKSELSRM